MPPPRAAANYVFGRRARIGALPAAALRARAPPLIVADR